MSNKKIILSHGATEGVTGSCHQLFIDEHASVLIDCGLFQGDECASDGSSFSKLKIDFDISSVKALFVTHCHIDHVGRIPYLLSAGFLGKIYCSYPTAELLPLILEDALHLGITDNKRLIHLFLKKIKQLVVPLEYNVWFAIPVFAKNKVFSLAVRLQKAGHILGSAYLEFDLKKEKKRVVFSGDLGAPYTPLLTAPKSPERADVLVLESTYGDQLHERRKDRVESLTVVIKRCFENSGVILIPAFSIGRTQELLYELEQIIYTLKKEQVVGDIIWDDLDIVVDSPLAAKFTTVYRKLKKFWDHEAKQRIIAGRHPLSFEQLTTIDSHQSHLQIVKYLKKSARPAIVIAASGMCSGGRIVNYLKSFIEDQKTDILFAGYQAAGTTGRIIQTQAAKKGFVVLDNKKYRIKSGVHTLSGYSAHADRANLIQFVKGIAKKPTEIRLVHGSAQAKKSLGKCLRMVLPDLNVVL